MNWIPHLSAQPGGEGNSLGEMDAHAVGDPGFPEKKSRGAMDEVGVVDGKLGEVAAECYAELGAGEFEFIEQ